MVTDETLKGNATVSEPEELELMGISVTDEYYAPDDEPMAESAKPVLQATEKKAGDQAGKTGKKTERESISKWFNQQFGGLFSDEDEEVK